MGFEEDHSINIEEGREREEKEERKREQQRKSRVCMALGAAASVNWGGTSFNGSRASRETMISSSFLLLNHSQSGLFSLPASHHKSGQGTDICLVAHG